MIKLDSMKRLLFTDSLGAGGAQRQLVGLAVLLKQQGYEVKVCTYFDIDFYKQYLDENRVEHEIIPNADNTKKRIFAVRRYFQIEKPNWVIAYQETPSMVACLTKIMGCKFHLIVSERNTTQNMGLNERIRFCLYHTADAIVPNSYAQEKFLLKHYPWMRVKIKTITNFVDLDRFSYVKRVRHRVPLIVIVASIWESKNTLGLIEGLKLLKNRGINFKVSWYGISEKNSDYLAQCRSKIEEYDLQDYIELYKKTKMIEKKYAEADYFCLPSFFEGTPNVICEAISTGLPIICSDVCDNSIYVKDGINGFLFDPHHPESIAISLSKALALNDEQYQLFCMNSRQNAETLLNSDDFVDKYIKIINVK